MERGGAGDILRLFIVKTAACLYPPCVDELARRLFGTSEWGTAER